LLHTRFIILVAVGGLFVISVSGLILWGTLSLFGEGTQDKSTVTVEKPKGSPPSHPETTPPASPEEYNEACQILKTSPIPNYIDAFWNYFEAHDLDPNGSTTFGYTLLGFAIARGETQVAMTLVELGADVNDATGGLTPAARAAAANNLPLLKFLEVQGADFSKMGSDNMMPIEYAGMNGAKDTYEYLSSKGAMSVSASEINDELFGLSEKMRKTIANQFLLAEDKARTVAEFYCPINMFVRFKEGDEIFLYQEVSLMPKLVEDDLAALGMPAITAPAGSKLKVSEVRKGLVLVKVADPETGASLCAGWAYVVDLWDHITCEHSGLGTDERRRACNEMADKLKMYYDEGVRKAYQITPEEQEEIIREKLRESWLTPASPTVEEKAAWIAEAEDRFGRRPPDFLIRIPQIDIP
jgi:hypothetical protein